MTQCFSDLIRSMVGFDREVANQASGVCSGTALPDLEAGSMDGRCWCDSWCRKIDNQRGSIRFIAIILSMIIPNCGHIGATVVRSSSRIVLRRGMAGREAVDVDGIGVERRIWGLEERLDALVACEPIVLQ